MVIRAPAVQLLGRQRKRDVLDYAVEAGADFRVARTVHAPRPVAEAARRA